MEMEMMKMRLTVQSGLLAFGAVVFAAGCGAGSTSGGPTPATAGASGMSATVNGGAGGGSGNTTTATAGSSGMSATVNGGAGGGSGDATGSASGGTVAVIDDGKAFVPEGIKYSLVDSGLALTLVSATVITDATGVHWFIAVRNDEAVPICNPEVNAAFTDATSPSNSLGGQAIVMVQGPMYQTDVGVSPCLLPGATGMGWDSVSGLYSATPKIVEIDYQPRGDRSAGATERRDLAVEGVTIANDPSGGKLVSGSVANHGTSALPTPSINVFAVDSGGRPFDAGFASSETDLAAGSSWSFQLTVRTPFNKYVAVPVWGSP